MLALVSAWKEGMGCAHVAVGVVLLQGWLLLLLLCMGS